MSNLSSVVGKEVIGPGHIMHDRNDVPQAFRQTPVPVVGAVSQPTVPQSTVPQPQ